MTIAEYLAVTLARPAEEPTALTSPLPVMKLSSDECRERSYVVLVDVSRPNSNLSQPGNNL
jgi:hypothetical protein